MLRPTETFPLLASLTQKQQEFDAQSPSIRAGKNATRTSMGPPPPSRAAWVWIWARAHFTGAETLRLRSLTKVLSWGHWLGDRAWGAGWSYQTRTHAPAARLREKASSANPLLAAQTPTVPPQQAGQCLQLKAPPPTRRGFDFFINFLDFPSVS